MKNVLCIDGGGTFLKYALFDENETILKEGRILTETESLERFLDSVERLYREHRGVSGIGMCMPGMIDVETGFMHTGGAIQCVAGINLARAVSERCDGVPVTIENDAKAAATAELVSGALRNCRTGVVIAVGTALGGTVVVDRKILRGDHIFAGEFSYAYYSNEHMLEQPPVSQFESDTSLATLWARRGGVDRMCRLYEEYSGKRIDSRSGEELFARIEEGDALAEKALRTCCHDLAMLLFNLQCFLDPEVIAIGGGVSAQLRFMETLQQEVDLYTATTLPGAPRVNLQPCEYRNKANLLGALYFHRMKTCGGETAKQEELAS